MTSKVHAWLSHISLNNNQDNSYISALNQDDNDNEKIVNLPPVLGGN